MMTEKIETLIIGGGQGGLATSYYLQQMGRENIVLEKAAQAGNVWRKDRWDSFTLLTPNWAFCLPGAEYQGTEPDGYMLKDEIVRRFEQYVERFDLPVHTNETVTKLEKDEGGLGYLVTTEDLCYRANNVVVATGLYQQPKIPMFSQNLPPEILQLHSGAYRNSSQLPQGAVLVVGSGQSGCQIAEELYQSGRKVYLSIGKSGRVPRRYRGKDVYRWMQIVGVLDQTVDQLPSPLAKFEANPHVSGRGGGHSLNLHQFARNGVVLLGHIKGVEGQKIGFNPDRNESLAKSDDFETKLIKRIDGFIEKQALNAPLESLPAMKDGFETAETTGLDVKKAGITSIIWANGYQFDFSMVKLPIFDGNGYPIQTRGVTSFPGIYFVGLPWLYKFKSGHLVGVAEDAEYVAEAIANRR